jgi:nucleoside-diphosphate-sugar epimerase
LIPGGVLILGCGYTGIRVARRLLAAGHRVIATTRNATRLQGLGVDVVEYDVRGRLAIRIPEGVRVLHSIPVVDGPDPTPRLLQALGSAPSRLVYLSTTGVYGNARDVDETTPARPSTPRTHRRAAAEEALARAPWPTLILRPAAIYGPFRGVHASLREGKFPLVDGGRRYTSRIHVDDLAAHAEAALFSRLTGAYPVADEEPCTSLEIATFCARLLGLPLPDSVPSNQASETRRADRRVDGSAIRRLLGVKLRYPTYRVGIPAAIEEEQQLAADQVVI